MPRRRNLLIGFGVLPLALVASYLYAEITVTVPTKPWHVTEITASQARCDSPTTFAYDVAWNPVFETWNPARAPSLWPHYVVRTYNCAATSLIHCQNHCTVRASGCSIRQGFSWMRISTYLTDARTSTGSFMQIGGIARPPLTFVDRKWQCINPGAPPT